MIETNKKQLTIFFCFVFVVAFFLIGIFVSLFQIDHFNRLMILKNKFHLYLK